MCGRSRCVKQQQRKDKNCVGYREATRIEERVKHAIKARCCNQLQCKCDWPSCLDIKVKINHSLFLITSSKQLFMNDPDE